MERLLRGTHLQGQPEGIFPLRNTGLRVAALLVMVQPQAPAFAGASAGEQAELKAPKRARSVDLTLLSGCDQDLNQGAVEARIFVTL